MLEIVPLSCPECNGISSRSLIWIHQNSRLTCDECGAAFDIDKDRLAVWLAEQERQEESAAATRTAP
jgi:uncharacterized protein YbaR (Trm112 family)